MIELIRFEFDTIILHSLCATKKKCAVSPQLLILLHTFYQVAGFFLGDSYLMGRVLRHWLWKKKRYETMLRSLCCGYRTMCLLYLRPANNAQILRIYPHNDGQSGEYGSLYCLEVILKNEKVMRIFKPIKMLHHATPQYGNAYVCISEMRKSKRSRMW